MSDESLKYWKEEYFEAVKKAKSYKDFLVVALKVLNSIPSSLCQVCGPISSGGKGSVQDNLKHFNKVIKKLESQGHLLFSQMPFEESMQRLKATVPRESSNTDLLNNFYLPLFESSKFKKFFFLCAWLGILFRREMGA